jgi:hypothetical protein
MGIPLLPALAPSGGRFSVYGWVANDMGMFSSERYRPSIVLVKHVLDRMPGRIPAVACPMADTQASFFRAVPDRPGSMTGRVPDIAGTMANPFPGSLRIVLDILADAILLCTCRMAECRKHRASDKDSTDFPAVHASVPCR